jgi:hypothetical protein
VSRLCQACDDAVRVVPVGEIAEEDIESFLWRITDEASHVSQKIQNRELDFFRTLDAESDLYARLEEGGFQVLRISPAQAETRTGCARVLMQHYTGGHGGFGVTALEGTMDVVITGDPASTLRLEVKGTLGAVEDGALIGVPMVPVEAVWDIDVVEQTTKLVSGRLGDIELPRP